MFHRRRNVTSYDNLPIILVLSVLLYKPNHSPSSSLINSLNESPISQQQHKHFTFPYRRHKSVE